MVFRMTRIVGRRSSRCSHVIKGSESETGPCRSLRKRPLVYGRDEGALNSIIIYRLRIHQQSLQLGYKSTDRNFTTRSVHHLDNL